MISKHMLSSDILFQTGAHSPEARVLLLEELGGFFSETNFLAMDMVATAMCSGATVGASVSQDNKEKAMCFLQTASMPPAGPALYLCGLAVKEDFRNLGIASALVAIQKKKARDMGYKVLLGDCWLESPQPSYNLLVRSGMKEVARVENFWHKEVPLKDLCPRCGDICCCTAVLLYEEL